MLLVSFDCLLFNFPKQAIAESAGDAAQPPQAPKITSADRLKAKLDRRASMSLERKSIASSLGGDRRILSVLPHPS